MTRCCEGCCRMRPQLWQPWHSRVTQTSAFEWLLSSARFFLCADARRPSEDAPLNLKCQADVFIDLNPKCICLKSDQLIFGGFWLRPTLPATTLVQILAVSWISSTLLSGWDCPKSPFPYYTCKSRRIEFYRLFAFFLGLRSRITFIIDYDFCSPSRYRDLIMTAFQPALKRKDDQAIVTRMCRSS